MVIRQKSLALAVADLPGDSQTEYWKACKNDDRAPGRRKKWRRQTFPYS
jgi:hypothetical protein